MRSLADVTQLLRQVAAESPEMRLLIVFGSVARGTATAMSDVDIGVIGGDIERFRVDAAKALHSDRVDVVDLSRSSPLVAMAAAREGKVIFESEPGTFSTFVSLAFRRYCDTAKLRQARRDQIDAFVRAHASRHV